MASNAVCPCRRHYWFHRRFSGDLSRLGEEIKQGVEVFARTHPEVKVIYEDDRWDSKGSPTSYRKLRDIDGVRAFVGPLGPAATIAIEGAMSDEDKNASFVAAITLCTDEFRNYNERGMQLSVSVSTSRSGGELCAKYRETHRLPDHRAVSARPANGR